MALNLSPNNAAQSLGEVRVKLGRGKGQEGVVVSFLASDDEGRFKARMM